MRLFFHGFIATSIVLVHVAIPYGVELELCVVRPVVSATRQSDHYVQDNN